MSAAKLKRKLKKKEQLPKVEELATIFFSGTEIRATKVETPNIPNQTLQGFLETWAKLVLVNLVDYEFYNEKQRIYSWTLLQDLVKVAGCFYNIDVVRVTPLKPAIGPEEQQVEKKAPQEEERANNNSTNFDVIEREEKFALELCQLAYDVSDPELQAKTLGAAHERLHARYRRELFDPIKEEESDTKAIHVLHLLRTVAKPHPSVLFVTMCAMKWLNECAKLEERAATIPVEAINKLDGWIDTWMTLPISAKSQFDCAAEMIIAGIDQCHRAFDAFCTPTAKLSNKDQVPEQEEMNPEATAQETQDAQTKTNLYQLELVPSEGEQDDLDNVDEKDEVSTVTKKNDRKPVTALTRRRQQEQQLLLKSKNLVQRLFATLKLERAAKEMAEQKNAELIQHYASTGERTTLTQAGHLARIADLEEQIRESREENIKRMNKSLKSCESMKKGLEAAKQQNAASDTQIQLLKAKNTKLGHTINQLQTQLSAAHALEFQHLKEIDELQTQLQQNKIQYLKEQAEEIIKYKHQVAELIRKDKVITEITEQSRKLYLELQAETKVEKSNLQATHEVEVQKLRDTISQLKQQKKEENTMTVKEMFDLLPKMIKAYKHSLPDLRAMEALLLPIFQSCQHARLKAELQTVVEMERQKTVEMERQKASESKLCNVCLEKDKTILLVPCRHRCVCHTCSEKLEICPICRTAVQEKWPVFD